MPPTLGNGKIAESGARLPWFRAALCLGILYFVVGLVSGTLAGRAASSEMRVGWRLAAWVISAAVFVAQVVYERLRLRNSSGSASSHSALAAAFGAFLLALAATVHKSFGAGFDFRYALALVLWPVITAVPAFVVALLLSAVFRPGPRSLFLIALVVVLGR